MKMKQELAVVERIAREAGQIALRHFGHVARLTKTHAAATEEAVTIADRLTQKFIIDALRLEFPGDGIVGEEDESGAGITFDVSNTDGRVWVIDPIDGTNNFIAGFGAWCVCIGLLEAGVPTLGVVYDVTRDTAYCGAKDVGAFVNDRPVCASTEPMGPQSLVMLTSNVLDRNNKSPSWITSLLGQTHWKIRILGSAALEAVHVAAGTVQAAVTVNGKIWDCVAPGAVVLASGGIITDLTGKPIFPFDLRNYVGAKVPFLAGGKVSHGEVLRVINAQG